MKLYCPQCREEREMILVAKKETYPVKGEDITIDATVCTCSKCSEEIFSMEHDEENLKRAYLQYRIRHNLLTPEKIKEIREQYRISQVTFARILGVGDKTIARYEGGSLQDEAINNLIMLAQNPENFLKLLDKNQEKISPDDVRNIRKDLGEVKVFVMWSASENQNKYDAIESADLDYAC